MNHQNKLIRKAFLQIFISFIGLFSIMLLWPLPQKRRNHKKEKILFRDNSVNVKFINLISTKRFSDLPRNPVIY